MQTKFIVILAAFAASVVANPEPVAAPAGNLVAREASFPTFADSILSSSFSDEDLTDLADLEDTDDLVDVDDEIYAAQDYTQAGGHGAHSSYVKPTSTSAPSSSAKPTGVAPVTVTVTVTNCGPTATSKPPTSTAKPTAPSSASSGFPPKPTNGTSSIVTPKPIQSQLPGAAPRTEVGMMVVAVAAGVAAFLF